jgi:hypothetical protein
MGLAGSSSAAPGGATFSLPTMFRPASKRRPGGTPPGDSSGKLGEAHHPKGMTPSGQASSTRRDFQVQPPVGRPSRPGHPFYQRLNELLEAEGFNEFVEGRCGKFYAAKYGRPSLTPGIYFRALLIGYFEGIGAERGIASLSKVYLGLCLARGTPVPRPPHIMVATRACAARLDSISAAP